MQVISVKAEQNTEESQRLNFSRQMSLVFVCVITLSCLFMQIAIGFTRFCHPYFKASDGIIAGLWLFLFSRLPQTVKASSCSRSNPASEGLVQTYETKISKEDLECCF